MARIEKWKEILLLAMARIEKWKEIPFLGAPRIVPGTLTGFPTLLGFSTGFQRKL
jgi:hypothetical protein